MPNISKINLSVIIPCFNCSHFLSQALDSLRAQTLSNIEFICLNDGSTDDTLSILNHYQEIDNRFKIIDKTNTGYGDSVNLGLSKATGKYIAIFEPDDFIEPMMYEELYNKAELYNLDVSKCCYFDFSEQDGDIYNPNAKIPKNKVLCPIDDLRVFLQSPKIWNAIYRRNWLLQNDIWLLPTPGASFQDTSFHFKTNLMANRYFCTDKAYYHYRSHPNNSVKSPKFPFAVCTEFEECARYGKMVGREHILKVWLLEQEFHTYKWNFLRLPEASREEFLVRWRNEWQQRSKKGYGFMKKKLYMYLFLLLFTPSLFIYYLKRKQRQEI